MTFNDALTVWRELLDVTRLIDAVHAVTKTERSEAVWQAGLNALEQRRDVLACVLSLEPQEFLEAVYARMVADVQTPDTPAPIVDRIH